MRKVSLVIALLVALTAVASANAAEAYFRINPEQALLNPDGNYAPSDEILVELVVDNGGSPGFNLWQVKDNVDPQGVASNPVVAAGFDVKNPGALFNLPGNILIQVAGGTSTTGTAQYDVLYSFMYHVPDVPSSTIIEISHLALNPATFGVTIDDGANDYIVPVGAMTIHVIPEPMTLSLLGLGGLGLLRRRR